MWSHVSHILALLASLTLRTAKWKWGKLEQTAFDDVNTISKEILLSYPDFTKPFQLYYTNIINWMFVGVCWCLLVVVVFGGGFWW
jgi:hypothetical protein